MRMSVTITDLAEADLEAVWSYVAADDPVAADDLLDRIMSIVDMLADTPQAGRIRSELGQGIRSYSTGNYLVLYRSDHGVLLILRVIHGARDIEELF